MDGNVMTGYIAHPIPDRKMVREWELKFEAGNPDVKLINPFIDIERESEEHLVAAETKGHYIDDPTEVVMKDVQAIIDSDFVVAWVTGQRSYGTLMEIVYAHQAGKPVYIICTNGHENHPFLRFHATHIFTAPEQFERYMRYHHGPRS